MAKLNPIARNQFVVTIKGIEAYWETCSAIKATRQTANYSDGLSNHLFKLRGPITYDNITLGKAFDPIADDPIIQWFVNSCDNDGKGEIVTIAPMKYCPEVAPLGKAAVLYGCKPVELTYPEVDKKSGDIAMLMITVSHDYFRHE